MYRARLKTAEADFEVESDNLHDLETRVEELRGSSLLTNLSPTESKRKSSPRASGTGTGTSQVRADLVEIVNAIKDSSVFTRIEEKVLGNRAELPRILTCLYFANDATDDPYLTTTNIETITNELGVRIKHQNVNRTCVGRGNRFVTADRVRKRGQPVRYKINYSGRQEFEKLLKAEP